MEEKLRVAKMKLEAIALLSLLSIPPSMYLNFSSLSYGFIFWVNQFLRLLRIRIFSSWSFETYALWMRRGGKKNRFRRVQLARNEGPPKYRIWILKLKRNDDISIVRELCEFSELPDPHLLAHCWGQTFLWSGGAWKLFVASCIWHFQGKEWESPQLNLDSLT